MDRLLAHLLKRVAPGDASVVKRWWSGLPAATQQDLAALWDRRGDSCSQTLDRDEDGLSHWHSLPIVRGRFVRPGEVAEEDEWRADHFEYILDHPEIYVPEPAATRSFHVGCTAQERARGVLAAGRLPADFTCPLDAAACPLRRLLSLAPGCDLQLSGSLIVPRIRAEAPSSRPDTT